MALGVRNYGNSLLVQNIFNPDNLPDTDTVLKRFCNKILRPTIQVVEDDCGTNIGRVVQIPESDPVGLINLEDESIITDDDIVENLDNGIYIMRLRDSSNCVSANGTCSNCARGYNARSGDYNKPPTGTSIKMGSSEVSYLNYIAGTFSGAMMGYLPLAADPLPTKARDWSTVTSHEEMNRMCTLLSKLKAQSDEVAYARTVEDLLERALLIIGMYGVYGNV